MLAFPFECPLKAGGTNGAEVLRRYRDEILLTTPGGRAYANLYDTLSMVEKNMILRALKKANYVQAHAAELLGIGKSGLNQKIKKYNLFDKTKP